MSAVMWINTEMPYAKSAELLLLPRVGAGSPANVLPSSESNPAAGIVQGSSPKPDPAIHVMACSACGTRF